MTAWSKASKNAQLHKGIRVPLVLLCQGVRMVVLVRTMATSLMSRQQEGRTSRPSMSVRHHGDLLPGGMPFWIYRAGSTLTDLSSSSPSAH